MIRTRNVLHMHGTGNQQHCTEHGVFMLLFPFQFLHACSWSFLASVVTACFCIRYRIEYWILTISVHRQFYVPGIYAVGVACLPRNMLLPYVVLTQLSTLFRYCGSTPIRMRLYILMPETDPDIFLVSPIPVCVIIVKIWIVHWKLQLELFVVEMDWIRHPASIHSTAL